MINRGVVPILIREGKKDKWLQLSDFRILNHCLAPLSYFL